jgi:phosphosulfolactate synthase
LSEHTDTNKWQEIISFPLGKRLTKPRNNGLTMVIDKGMGLEETRDLLKINYQHIDFVKLAFGTPALYAPGTLEKKIQLVRSYKIDIYPGGTFLEVALLQDKAEEFLDTCRFFGFTAIEVSDGTISLSAKVREKTMALAAAKGFRILTEVGKKNNGAAIPVETLADTALRDLANGAYKVILEGRECGLDVGLYDAKGRMVAQDLAIMLDHVGDPSLIIWETPLKDQQQDLITRFGSNVNLGNIPPNEVLALEALRVGLRADTLQLVLEADSD